MIPAGRPFPFASGPATVPGRMAKPKAKSPFLSGRRIAPRPVRGSVRAADLIDQTFSAYNAARLREGCASS